MYGNKIDTWDCPWTASVWFHGGLTATPNVNLVSNVGFGSDATHTISENKMSRMKTFGFNNLINPAAIKQSLDADRYFFDEFFDGKSFVYPYKLISDLKSVLRLIGIRRFWS